VEIEREADAQRGELALRERERVEGLAARESARADVDAIMVSV
jgi:hypothetical protein